MLGITEEEWGLAALEMGIEYDIKTQLDPNEVSLCACTPPPQKKTHTHLINI